MDNKNLGSAILNNSAVDLPEKTILVLGIGRGGTSMTAGVLAKLGVYMGEDLTSRYQDSALLDCLNRNDRKQARQIIAERNAKFTIWGLKKLRLWRWDRLFRQPVYVAVFRDLAASAQRSASLFDRPFLREMAKMLVQQGLLLFFLWRTRRPVLIVSYEKALLNPHEFVAALVEFLGLEPSQEQLEQAQLFIAPSPADYTSSPVNYRSAQQTRDQLGYIERIEATRITGWALSTQSPAPASLALFIDGRLIANAVAQSPRPDVAAADPRFHARCGFVFTLPEQQRLRGGEQVEVRFADSNEALLNSPRRY